MVRDISNSEGSPAIWQHAPGWNRTWGHDDCWGRRREL